MSLPFAGAPHVFIVHRDDWIEITTHCISSGCVLRYTIRPQSEVLREWLDENGKLETSEYALDKRIMMIMYQALEEIADTAASNLSALYDRLDHPEAYGS